MPNTTSFDRLLRRNVETVPKIEALLQEEPPLGTKWIRRLIRGIGTPTSAVVHV